MWATLIIGVIVSVIILSISLGENPDSRKRSSSKDEGTGS